MRALSKQQLSEQKFEMFVNDTSEGSKLFFPVRPYEFLKVSEDANDYHKFEIQRDKLVVLYDQAIQSSLMPKDGHPVFYIDNCGYNPQRTNYFLLEISDLKEFLHCCH